MNSQKVTLYFHFLALLAVFLLWGVSLLNGTVKSLIFAVWNGQLGEGGAGLKTDYTGFPLLDYPLALLVAFFFHGTNGHDEGYQLFLFDAYSTLQSAFVWLYVETFRPGNRPKWIDRPIVFGLLWQCFGAAISLPLYYAAHLQWINQGKVMRDQHLEKARALPLSFFLGAVVPALVGMAPTWLGPKSRSMVVHQIILAAWQLDPVWVSWLLKGISGATTWFRGRSTGTNDDKYEAYRWVRSSYLLAAASSALGHLYVIGRVLTSDSQMVNLVRMYVPFTLSSPARVEDIFVWGPRLFLQYDLIIISLSSLSWVFLLLGRIPPGQRFGRGTLALILFTGCVTIGPGATVSLALFIREGYLPEYHKSQ